MEGEPGTAPISVATSASLLAALSDPDNRTVWNQYVGRYRPLLVRYGRRLGLGADEAEDVAQQTLLTFSTSYRAGRYELGKGRLRSWLFGIARNELLQFRRRGRRDVQAPESRGGDGLFDQIAAREDLEAVWEQEWRKAVLGACLEQVRREVQPQSYEAFDLFALQGRPAVEVAARLGVTPNAVFLAKRRILHRVRELLPLVDDLW